MNYGTIKIEGENYVPIEHAAFKAHVSAPYLSKLARSGELFFKEIKGNVFILESSLTSFIAKRELTFTAHFAAMSSSAPIAAPAPVAPAEEIELSAPVEPLVDEPAPRNIGEDIDIPAEVKKDMVRIERPRFSHETMSFGEAAVVAGLSANYIGKLARSGEMQLVQEHGESRIVRTSLNSFMKAHARRLEERKEKLAKERQQEYVAHAPIKPESIVSPIQSSQLPVVRANYLPMIALVRPLGVLAIALVMTSAVFGIAQNDTRATAISDAGHAMTASALQSIGDFFPSLFSGIARAVNTNANSLFASVFGDNSSSGPVAAQNDIASTQSQSPTRSEPAATYTDPAPVKSAAPTTVTQTIIQQPVYSEPVERVIERVVEREVVVGGITQESLYDQLQQLDNKLSSRMYGLISANTTAINQNYQVTAQSNAINQLSNTTITNPTITGGSISGTSVSVGSLSVSNTATSSFGGGIDLTAGCFSVNGVCIGSSGGSSNVSTSTANNWSALQIFAGGASSTDLSNFGTAYFGGSATTTIDEAGNLAVGGTFSGAGLSACAGATDKLLWDSVTKVFSCGVDAGAGSGISGLRGEYSSYQNGAGQTFATTTDANISLTITSAGDIHTFSPTWSGSLAVNRGGTGTTTTPAYGQLLLGNSSGGYDLVATSSLGILSGGTWGSITGTLSNQTDLQAALDAKLSLTNWHATTTDALAEGSTNFYFTTNRFATALAGTTTDALPQGSTNKYFSVGGVNDVINASTTIVKAPAAPTYGQVLIGNSSGGFNLVATSTLGLSGGGGGSSVWGSFTGTLSDQADLQAALDAKLSLTNWYATTTDGLAQGSTNKYYSDTAVNTLINASTTLAKTTLANIWNPLQTFTNGFISNASSTVAGNFTSTGVIAGNSFVGAGTGLTGTAASLSIGGNAGTATALQTGRTINGTTFDGTGNIVITAASSTLLANDNTFSGTNSFTGATTLGSATSTNFFSTTASSTNLFAQSALFGTITTNLGTPAGSFLAVNPNGQIIATTTPSGGGGAGTWGSFTGTLSDQADLQAALDAKLSLTNWYATTTDGLAQGNTNFYFTTNRFATALAGTTTTALAEGTNKYWTDIRFDNRLSATTTLPNLTTLANLTTTGTITSGTWSGLFGAVSGANLTNITAANISAGTAGIDISGTAGTATALQTARNINGTSFNGTADITITAASSTLLANSNTWSALQLFSAGASTTNFSNFGTAYFGGTATSSFNSAGILDLANQGQSTSTILTLGGIQFLSASSSSSAANTFLGLQTGASITTGKKNSAFGYQALKSNDIGDFNTAVGYQALYSNVGDVLGGASYNTAIGYQALYSNAGGGGGDGLYNTATGYQALYSSTGDGGGGGNYSTANGYQALYNNPYSTENTAIGYAAGRGAIGGGALYGTYVGFQAGFNLDTGADANTLIGTDAGYSITTGAHNVVLGDWTTTVGQGITTGSNNILIGQNVRSGLSQTGSNQLNIGNLIFGTGLSSNATLSSGNVGIGTTTPWAKLSIVGTAGQINPIFHIASSTGASFFTIAGDTGNVGIGTTTPGSILSIQGVGNFVANATSTLSSGINLTSGCFSVNGTCVGGGGSSLTGTTGQFAYFSGTDTAIGTSSLFIAPSSNVGIGTTTPSGKFTVQGSGTGTGVLASFVNSAYTTVMSMLDNGTSFFLGNLGVGTTTPQRRLDVVETNSNAQLRLSNTATAFAEFLVDALGNLKVTPAGGSLTVPDTNLFVCQGGSCPTTTATSSAGNLFVENAVTIGDGFSLRQIDSSNLGMYNVAGSLIVTFDSGI